MATSRAKNGNLLYLGDIILQDVPNREYTLTLLVDNEERELLRKDNQTWAPTQRLGVSPTSQLHVEIQMNRAHLRWVEKARTRQVINLQELFNDYWASESRELAVREGVAVGKYSCTLESQFFAEPNAESIRSSLRTLEKLLDDYSPLMSESTEKALEKAMKYGAAFAEVYHT